MNIVPPLSAGFFSALLAVLTLMPLARRWALALDFVDKPGGRKDHVNAVPPIGGLVILPVYMAVSWAIGLDIQVFWPLYAALGLILVIGGIDDYRHVNPWPRFIAQFAAASLIVVPGQAELTHLGDLFGTGLFTLGWMSLPFSIVAVVLLINALNMMDGLDGLLGGKSFIIFFWLGLACVLSGHLVQLLPLMPIMGALVGFLAYNMRSPFRTRASVFLGDAGSMGLALVIAWFTIDLAQEPDAVTRPIVVAWILALPIFDICAQFYRRVRKGRHPFEPDRGHFHHHVIHAGFTHGRATLFILALGLVLGGIGYLGDYYGMPYAVLTAIWISCLFIHIILSFRPKTYITLLSRLTGNVRAAAPNNKTNNHDA